MQIEAAVAEAVTSHLQTTGALLISQPSVADAERMQSRLTHISGTEAFQLVRRVDVASGLLIIHLNKEALSDAFEVEVSSISSRHMQIDVPFQIRRRGIEAKLIIGAETPAPDQTLIRAIAHAFVWLEDIKSGEQVRDIAARYNRPPDKLLLRLRLAFLSPRIIEVILEGRQPPELTLTRLMKMRIPSDWNGQWRELGFESTA